MLSRYFKLKLEKLGFSEVSEVLYSLSYCQGDGCSFEAKIGENEVIPIINRMHEDRPHLATERHKDLLLQYEQSQLVRQYPVYFSITQRDSHYVHDNTMSIDWEHKEDFEETLQYLLDPTESLSEHILEYAKQCARKLEPDGYGLIDAFRCEPETVWQYKTREFLIQLSKESEDIEYFDHDFYLDDEEYYSICQEYIQGRQQMATLIAEVFVLNEIDMDSIDEYEPVEQSLLSGVSFKSGDPTFGGVKSELIGEVIQSLRSLLEQLPQQQQA